MSVATGREPLDWLAEAAAAGEIHTVRVSWADRLGTWRGKRLPVDVFLRSPERRIGFCDGMIVVDVNCDVIQETPFSNFETGYPDMYLRPRLETLGTVGWNEGEAYVLGRLEDHHGTPLGVAPANVLERVGERLARAGVELTVRLTVRGRLMRGRGEPLALLPDGVGRDEQPPGVLRLALEGLARSGVAVRFLEADADGAFRIGLGALAPTDAAWQAVLVKAALKELTRPRAVDAVFMTLPPGAAVPSLLEIEATAKGAAALDAAALRRRLAELRGVLQPSVNAFKAGPIAAPAVAAADGGTLVSGLAAASEADPATALIAVAAAIGAEVEGGEPAAEPAEPEGLDGAASLLAASAWARDWLGDDLVANAVPLLRSEAALFQAAVTDWELDRYWSAG